MLKNIEFIGVDNAKNVVSQKCIALLNTLNREICMDFHEEEIVFFFPHYDTIILDFDNLQMFMLSEDEFLDLNNRYGNEDLPDMYHEDLDYISKALNTDVYILGSGYRRVFVIKVYNKYICLTHILIDNDDGFDPEDLDDGEPIFGSFFIKNHYYVSINVEHTIFVRGVNKPFNGAV